MAVFEKDQLLRWGAEAFVIFGSIVLALLADEAREYRNERVREHEQLELLRRDLVSDSTRFTRYVEELREQEAAAIEFVRQVEAGEPSDSLQFLLAGAITTYNFRPSQSVFSGLRATGELSIMQDAELRGDITDYYDLISGYMLSLKTSLDEDADRIQTLTQRHAKRVYTGAGRIGWTRQIESTTAEMNADQEFMRALTEAAAFRAFFAARLEDIFLFENNALLEAIDGAIAGR